MPVCGFKMGRTRLSLNDLGIWREYFIVEVNNSEFKSGGQVFNHAVRYAIVTWSSTFQCAKRWGEFCESYVLFNFYCRFGREVVWGWIKEFFVETASCGEVVTASFFWRGLTKRVSDFLRVDCCLGSGCFFGGITHIVFSCLPMFYLGLSMDWCRR